MKYLLLFFLSMNFSYATKLEVNSDHSQIYFEAKYLLGSVKGTFEKTWGIVELDPNREKIVSAEFHIMVNSLHTGHKTRDGHLKGTDFFAAGKYPLIKFKTKNIPYSGSVVGQLQIKNIEKDITINLKYLGEKMDPWQKLSYYFSFTTEINRNDFNINWNKSLDKTELLIAKKVKISGSLQLQLFQGKTPSWMHMIPQNLNNSSANHKSAILNPTKKIPMQITNKDDKKLSNKKPGPKIIIILSKVLIAFFAFMGAVGACFYSRKYFDNKINQVLLEVSNLVFISLFSYAAYLALI